jgi:hypothetical protein
MCDWVDCDTEGDTILIVKEGVSAGPFLRVDLCLYHLGRLIDYTTKGCAKKLKLDGDSYSLE